jgi:hypothetical protein
MTDRIEQVWSKRSMNQYIRGLWTQAGGRFDPGGPDKLPGFVIADPKAFAELIVRECAELCDVNDKEQGDILREHFGVEETRSQKMRDAGFTRRPKGWTKEEE